MDSHLGLPIIKHPRERLEQIGAAAVQGRHRRRRRRGHDGAHRDAGARSDAEHADDVERSRSSRRLLRKDLGFGGLIYTDSMGMAGVTAIYTPGEAAVRAVKAGNDVVLHSPDDGAAFAAIMAAVKSGEIPQAQLDESVERDPPREGARRPAPQQAASTSTRSPTSSAARARTRRSRTRSASGRSRCVKDDAQPGAAEGAARRAGAVPVGARLPVRLAHRGAEPDVHPGAAQALAERDGGRAVGADDARRRSSWCARWRRASTRSIASVFVRAGSASGRMDLAAPLAAAAARLAHRGDASRS